LDKSATPDRDPLTQPAVNSADNLTTATSPPSAPAPAPPAPGPEETPPEVPLTPMGWLAQNAIYLVIIAALVIWIVSSFGWEGLPKAGLTIVGIGFIIFIHELGHFLVAKWCDVHVLTFSIGFGPALPGCSFKRGETTYKLSLLPLGGYVNMIGEGSDADESEDYPRSFKNKSVGQRMAIISAGVIMNVIFGIVSFIFVFQTHGVERTAATVGIVDPGSPAWEKGVHSGWRIDRIGSNDRPFFNDLQQKVMLSGQDEEISFTFFDPYHEKQPDPIKLTPRRSAGGLTPVIGVSPLRRVELELLPPRYKKLMKMPCRSGSSAAAARALDLGPGDRVLQMTDPKSPKRRTALGAGSPWYDEFSRRLLALSGEEITVVVLHKGKEETLTLSTTGFDFGDRIVGMTDPARAGEGEEYDPFKVSVLACDPRGDSDHRDPVEFQQRLKKLTGKPVVIQVRRHGADEADPPVGLFVPPSFHLVLGARMEMGIVAAVRNDSPAKQAGLEPQSEGAKDADIISGVVMKDGQGHILFQATDDPEPPKGAEALDPVRLPSQLAAAARRQPKDDKWVTLTVRRAPKGQQNQTRKPKPLGPMKWDWKTWDDCNEMPFLPSSPLSIPQLGIAYWVTSRISERAVIEPDSAAAQARRLVKLQDRVSEHVPDALKRGDVIYRIRFRSGAPGEPKKWGRWNDLKGKRDEQEVHEKWAFTFRTLQRQDSRSIQLGIQRANKDIEEPMDVTLQEDRSWPLESESRGLQDYFVEDTHLERAENPGEALRYGVQETGDFIRNMYLGLSRVITGRVSTETFGGPISIVSTTFLVSEDPYKFLIFLAVLSINLAVVNFLPIPLLDGGHMVFLIYEKLRGKPASEHVRTIATYIGLAMLLTLMVYVFILDIKRWILG
jgi:regulator of sigma E protease